MRTVLRGPSAWNADCVEWWLGSDLSGMLDERCAAFNPSTQKRTASRMALLMIWRAAPLWDSSLPSGHLKPAW